MRQIILNNNYFFRAFALFLIVGAVLLSVIDQGDAILFFSEHRTAIGDFFFKYGTRLGEETGYLLMTILFVFLKPRAAFIIPLTGVLATIIAYGAKRLFSHPRPLRYFSDLNMMDTIQVVEGVHLNSGLTSFPSGHTIGAFALFGLVALLLPKKRGMGLLLFSLALIVGISRIYLVQHFLKDVYLGSIIGVMLAMAIYWAQFPLSRKEGVWYNRGMINGI